MQQFQFLTRDEKIVMFKPYNPFAQGMVEIINNQPTESQLEVMKNLTTNSGVSLSLTVLGVNGEYNIVLYLLELT